MIIKIWKICRSYQILSFSNFSSMWWKFPNSLCIPGMMIISLMGRELFNLSHISPALSGLCISAVKYFNRGCSKLWAPKSHWHSLLGLASEICPDVLFPVWDWEKAKSGWFCLCPWKLGPEWSSEGTRAPWSSPCLQIK